MTRYAYDAERHTLVATWATGIGDRAITVADIHAEVIEEAAGDLASRLTHSSEVLWRTYTHPASAADDDMSPNTEGSRRTRTREAITKLVVTLREPNLPQDGMLLQSYISVEEAGHGVGRSLHQIGSTALTDIVVADVEAEIDAVERAERGDLTGRAAQAVVLTRADAPPVHVAAANVLFESDPFGPEALFREIDPTGASVAAAHWLASAAAVAAKVSGYEPETIVEIADDIEALPTETPTEVLRQIYGGSSPLDVVVDMVGAAMSVADREITDISRLAETLEEAEGIAARHSLDPSKLGLRLVPLDLFRPAPDMLEDLVTGIHGCFLLWSEHAPEEESDADEEETEEEMTAQYERRRAEFADAVRRVARAKRRRIGL
jgi:hypothetical protein